MWFSIISYRKQLSIIPKTYVSLSCPRQTNSWVNAFFFSLFLLEYHMSPLGRAAYSREVKALPSSYHTGCAHTRQFERKSDTCRDGHLETHFCGWLGGGAVSTDFSALFLSLIGDGQCHRVQWGNPLRCSVFKSPFGYNGCDVAQLFGSAVDEHLRSEVPRTFTDEQETQRRKNMKKQFNRMKQLANQTVGRWVFILLLRVGVTYFCRGRLLLLFMIWHCDVSEGPGYVFLRNYLQSLASFRKVKSRNYTCPHDTCTLIFNDL